MIALTACTVMRPPAAVPPPSGPVTPAAAEPDPCERAAAQQARAAGLIEAGRIDRAVRVITHADGLCPKTAAASRATLVSALVTLGRIDEAKVAAEAIDHDPQASPADREAAARAREAKPGTEDAEALIEAAFAARAKGSAAEAQRLFDRAAARIERDGKKLTLEMRNGLEVGSGLPWKSNGGIFPRSLGVTLPGSPASHDGKRVAHADGRLVIVADQEKRRVRLRLEGHEANITSIAWSSNDQLIATGAYDGSARVWDANTGQLKLTVQPSDVVRGVRFLKHGTVLACIHEDASAWDVATGKALGRASGAAASAAEIDPDGVVTMTDTGEPRERFDLFTGARLDGPVPRAAAYTPDDTLSVAAFADRIEIRRYPGGKLVRKIANKGDVRRVWIARDGKRVAAGEEDIEAGPIRRIKTWSVATGRPIGTMPVREEEGYGIEVTDIGSDEEMTILRGGKPFAIAPRGGKVLRSRQVGDKPRALDGLGGDDALTPDAIAFAGDGETVAVMLHREEGEDWPSRLALIDLRAGAVRDLEGARPANELRFLPGGKLLSWHYNDVAVWDLASGKPATILDGNAKHFGILHVSSDGRFALARKERDEHTVIDLATGEPIRGEQPGRAVFVGSSPDGAGLFFTQPDGKLVMLDARTGKLRAIADAAAGRWDGAAGTQDGKWALLVERESPARAFLHTIGLDGGAPRRIDRALDTVEVVGAAGDRGLIVRTREAGTQGAELLQLLDVSKGTPVRAIRSELWEMGSTVPAHDPRIIAASSRPEALFGLWSVESGEPLAALRVLANRKTAYVITAEGQIEILGDATGVLRDHAYCLAGARVYPVEVCEERYVTPSILRRLARHDMSWRDP
ncbi:MAG: WD40 repeat domain-containing protein [Minicystis sp.]